MTDRRRQPGPEPDWCERWRCWFATETPRLAGTVELTLYPHQPASAFALSLAREGQNDIRLDEPAAPLPRWPHLELRTSGLWVELSCPASDDHFTVQLEAFALEVEDPADVLGRPVPVGLDLEWDGVDRDCTVYGEVLVGDDRYEIDGRGGRAHTWGPPC